MFPLSPHWTMDFCWSILLRRALAASEPCCRNVKPSGVEMYSRRKWTCLPSLLLLLFALVACGPPLQPYTAQPFPTPMPTGGGTGGSGTGQTGPPSTSGQSETSSPAETTDGTGSHPGQTDTASPSETGTPTATPTTSAAEAPIECAQYRLPSESASPPESTQAADSSQTPDLVVNVAACSVARVEPSEFAGCLFVSVQLQDQIDGAAPLPPVLVTLTSDTGLQGQGHLSPDREPEFNQIRVDLHADHFNREHLLTIKVDPDGEVSESDENNNSVDVKINVPSEDKFETSCPAEKPSPTPTLTIQGGSGGTTPPGNHTDPAVNQG